MNFLNKSYYKYKIIITFSVVTILLVAILSKISYGFMKEFYLEQLSDNVKKTTSLTAVRIDTTYLSFIKDGIITQSIKKYFTGFFNGNELKNIYSEIFIFDKNLNIIIHSDSTKLTGKPEPRLLLNETEILKTKQGSAITSLPFKGNDGKWYLWGFTKLTKRYWLAVKESAENFKKIDKLSNIIWYIGSGAIVLSILLGFVVANSITQPVNKLVNFSNEIGKGNYKAKVPQNMKGELQTLAKAMDLMKSNIADNEKEKEKILAQIAHEIRNPLGGIELLTNLINESLEDNKNKNYAKRILNEINGLKELITSYLDYSKPAPASKEKIDLTEIINETISILENDIKNKNIVIKKDIKLKSIIFDKNHLRNILINLVKNSIEAINKNGEITIKTFSSNLSEFISVKDSGNGISKNDLHRIFEPFHTTKINGTGLGLATCKKYCDENNAKISVKNLTGGCVFTIEKEITNE